MYMLILSAKKCSLSKLRDVFFFFWLQSTLVDKCNIYSGERKKIYFGKSHTQHDEVKFSF